MANKRWEKLREEGFEPKKKCRLCVDVAGMGRDASVLCPRYDNYVDNFEVHNSAGVADHMHVCGMTIPYLKKKGTKAFIDTIGEGAGVFSRLRELSYHNAYSCKFSEGARLPMTSRGIYVLEHVSHLYWAVKDWLNPKNGFQPALPPNDFLLQECTDVHWKFKGSGDILIEDKDGHQEASRSIAGLPQCHCQHFLSEGLRSRAGKQSFQRFLIR